MYYCEECGAATPTTHKATCSRLVCTHSELGYDPDTPRRDWEFNLYRDEKWEA